MRYLCLTIAAFALALPAAALAAGAPSPSSLASQSCKTQQAQMGALFKTTYGTNASRSNAFGQCVAKATRTATSALQSAAKTCKAQQADQNFVNAPNNPNHLSFDAFYGANGQAKGKGADANALGKCIATLAKQSTDRQTQADVAAAKTCKTELAASKASFTSNYGSGRNAFGVCVSRHAKSK
jgi:hypothetical protein